MSQKFDYITIEPYSGREQLEGFTVYGHDTYPRTSVLAGQPLRQYLGHFDTVEDAQAAFPEAEVREWSTKVDIPMSDVPPGWFDERNAGEVWHEDDY